MDIDDYRGLTKEDKQLIVLNYVFSDLMDDKGIKLTFPQLFDTNRPTRGMLTRPFIMNVLDEVMKHNLTNDLHDSVFARYLYVKYFHGISDEYLQVTNDF